MGGILLGEAVKTGQTNGQDIQPLRHKRERVRFSEQQMQQEKETSETDGRGAFESWRRMDL